MKYIKIAFALVVAAALFSCEKTEVFNGTAKVGFKSEETRVTFANFCEQIPVLFEGTSNVWPITLNVEVVPYDGKYAAVEDKDFLITSYTLNFGMPADYNDSLAVNPDYKTVIEDYIEVNYPNRSDEVELRFKLKISSVTEGVTIDPEKSETLVIAAISDASRLSADDYVMGGESYTKEDNSLTAAGAANYEKVTVKGTSTTLTVTKMFGEAKAKFKFEMAEDGMYVNIPLGMENSYSVTETEKDEEDNDVKVKYNIGLGIVDASLQLKDLASVKASYDENYNAFVFDSEVTGNYLTLVKYDENGEFVSFYKDTYFVKGLTLKRK